MKDIIDPTRHSYERMDRASPRILRSGESLTIYSYDVETAATGKISPFTGLWATFTEGRALSRIFLRIISQDDDDYKEQLAQVLRSAVLSIKFDGKETIWVPLGDFFGSGVGLNSYKSWYVWIEEDGTMFSRWEMPFRKTVEVQLINYGDQDISFVSLVGLRTDYQWDDRSMYFHANWRQQQEIETIAGDGTMDWNYITLKGRGVFVGDVLSIVNRSPFWWGEGDEKIYVDGKNFPAHFGTGTANYYGYAGGLTDFFEAPLHFQSRVEGPDNFGNTTNGRVRLLDAIPFTADFRFDMEIWHLAATNIDYAATTFWYGFVDTTPVGFPSREEQIVEVRAPVSHRTPMTEIEPPAPR